MIIRTHNEVLLLDCDCCAIPICDAPRKECQSITINASSDGYFKPGETTWKIYKKQEFTTTITSNYTSVSGDIVESTNGFETNGNEQDLNFEATSDCKTWVPASSAYCSSEATKTLSFYDVGGEEAELSSRYQIDRSSAEGEEPQSHIDWRTTYPTQEDYDNAVAARQQYQEDYSDYEDAWQAWYDGGEIGDEPQPPEFVEEPTPEPPATYPPCTWKDTTVFTDFQEDPPEVYDPVVNYGGALTTMYGGYGAEDENTVLYLLPSTYSEWVASTKSTIETGTNYETLSCLGTECKSSFTVSPELSGSEVYMTLIKHRYRFGVPADYSSLSATRSTWEMQWSEVFFPALSSLSATLVADREWVWNGDMENPWSDWFEVTPPTDKGEIRAVNVLTKCYKSTRLGVKPTSWGEITEL